MSFGFSVGDFVAVGALILKIVDTLRGAQSEYQELIRELENLRRALSQVDKLKGRGDQAIAVDLIKCIALTCRYQLEDFLAKIQKYEKSLGIGKSVTKIKDASRKIQYAFGKKDEANTLRTYLNIHIGTINMLLVRQGLEMLEIASEQTDKNKEELSERIEDSSRELREVGGNVEAQALAIKENNSIIQKLFTMVSGELVVPLISLSQTVAKVCVSTQQIYTIVLDLKASLSSIDTRFTYFQAPVRVEDALGGVFPFPSECSIEALNAEIIVRFKEGPGNTEVMAGDFELFNAKNAEQVLTVSGPNKIIPEMSINMAIVLVKEFAEGDKCPMPHCVSRTFVEAVGGGRTCSECKVWFDRASKKRKRNLEGERISKHIKTLADRNRTKAKRPKTRHSDLEETSISAFKRIRFDTGLGREQLYEAAEAQVKQDEENRAREEALRQTSRDLISTFDHLGEQLARQHRLEHEAQQASAAYERSVYVQNSPKATREHSKPSLEPANRLEPSPTPERLNTSSKSNIDNTMFSPGGLNDPDLATKASELSLPLFDETTSSTNRRHRLSRARRVVRTRMSLEDQLALEGKKRLPRTQASHGDAVLIGYMGGLNHPDLPLKAGEVPLPQSDDSDVEEPIHMGGNDSFN